MQTYLGLDIGTYSIKAVVLKMSFEDTYIEEMQEIEIPYSSADNDEKLAKTQALKSILSTLKDKEFDSIYTSLGCQFTVMKRFDLNNVKRADRQRIIESEFDLLGLFNLDEYAIEYYTIKFDKTYAKLLGILINKLAAKSLIDILTNCQLSVRTIDIDNISILNLINFLPTREDPSTNGAELFLDIGHSKTSFTIIENNKIINTRVFNIGGLHLTNHIKNALDINYEEAKNIKHNIQSFTDNKKYNEVKTIISNFFEEICSEIKRTIKTLNANEFVKINRIFLSGSSNKLEGVEQIFENSLGIKSTPLTFSNTKLRLPSETEISFNTFSQAISVALRGNLNKTNSRINIRHGELALISNYEKIISEVSKYAKLASIFVIVLLGTYYLRYFLFEHRINEMKTHYKQAIVRLFSTEPKELRLISGKKNWDFQEYSDHAIKLIKESTDEKKELIESLSASKTSIPLKLLNQISLAIPKDTYFEVVNFKYQEGVLYFEADTDSSQSVATIVSKLQDVKILSQIVKKSETNKAGSGGQLVHFSVTANVRT